MVGLGCDRETAERTLDRPAVLDTPPRPELDPIHGWDGDKIRAWMAEYADDADFEKIYGERKARILSKLATGASKRVTDQLGSRFLARVQKLPDIAKKIITP